MEVVALQAKMPESHLVPRGKGVSAGCSSCDSSPSAGTCATVAGRGARLTQVAAPPVPRY